MTLSSLSSIYSNYLTMNKEEKERDPKRLFLSDIGKCPRQVAYRLLETKEEYESEQSKINKTIMFDLAEHIEEALWMALDAEGMVIAFQPEVDIYDRENWGGRADILADYYGRRVIEVKSVYPGAFNYSLVGRYPQHQHQARAYHHYLEEPYSLDSEPILAYFDRGGQNTPQEVSVDVEWASTCQEMGTLDHMRERLPELPEKLGKVISLRSYEKEIIYGPDPRCRLPYCRYVDTECHPDQSVSVWAVRKKERGRYTMWDVKRAANPELLLPFIDTIIDKATEGN